MEVTLKFNKGSKEGKTLLQLLEAYVRNNKSIQMTRPHTQTDLNEESLESMKKTSKGIGVSKAKKLEDFIGDVEKW